MCALLHVEREWKQRERTTRPFPVVFNLHCLLGHHFSHLSECSLDSACVKGKLGRGINIHDEKVRREKVFSSAQEELVARNDEETWRKITVYSLIFFSFHKVAEKIQLVHWMTSTPHQDFFRRQQLMLGDRKCWESDCVFSASFSHYKLCVSLIPEGNREIEGRIWGGIKKSSCFSLSLSLFPLLSQHLSVEDVVMSGCLTLEIVSEWGAQK